MADKALSRAALASLMREAHVSGMAAGRAVTPTPMVLRPGSILVNDAPISDKTYVVPEGPCGFAWVTVRPANSRAAKAMAEAFNGTFGGHASIDRYAGGMMLWVAEFNQSMVRKAAYADAFAKVLTDAGIRASADSRMD